MNINELATQIESNDDPSGLYLLCPLSEDSGFFTSEKKLLYISRDSDIYPHQEIETDYLTLQTHVSIKAVENNQTFSDGEYNIIVYKGTLSESSAASFAELCAVHANNKAQLGFRDFFYSLILLFQLPSEQGFKNAIGLYGELKLMQMVYNRTGKDISEKWHRSGSQSKYDFSNGENNIEVKCTTSGESMITIKHTQIFNDHPCYLAVVYCELYNNGQTIDDVVSEMQMNTTAFKNLNFCINLAKEMKRISSQEATELRFSVTDVQFFLNTNVNPFPELPESVSDIVYKLDLSYHEPLDEKDVDALMAVY